MISSIANGFYTPWEKSVKNCLVLAKPSYKVGYFTSSTKPKIKYSEAYLRWAAITMHHQFRTIHSVCIPLHSYYSHRFRLRGNWIYSSRVEWHRWALFAFYLVFESIPSLTCWLSRCMHSRDKPSSKSLRCWCWMVQGWLYFENLVWLCLFTIRMKEIMV